MSFPMKKITFFLQALNWPVQHF